jgi:hypothetical protein
MNTTTDTPTLFTLIAERANTDKAYEALRNTCRTLKTQNDEVRRLIEKVKYDTDHLENQATTGMCFAQTMLGGEPLYSPAQAANQLTGAVMVQNQIVTQVHQLALVVDAPLREGETVLDLVRDLVAYVVAVDYLDWKVA